MILFVYIYIPHHHNKFSLAVFVGKRLDLLKPIDIPHPPGTLVEGCNRNPEGDRLEFPFSEI